RLTGNLASFAPNAEVIHIDIDPAEIGKNVPTAIPIVSDAKAALVELLKSNFESPDTTEWHGKLNAYQEAYPLQYH
ncbi:acetolactate synthase large subunit, partial [Streptococcus pneumoniae]|nr:acetolactate synthase large subunit [Streptococcus pneumoniae]